MNWKQVIKISLAIMSCSIFIFNFIGCRNYEKENKEALKYLNDKYGKEFKLSGNFISAYGDEFYQSPQKCTEAWPEDNPEEVFKIYFDQEDNLRFRDNYQNIIMKPYIDNYLDNMIKGYWSNCKIYIVLHSGLIEEKFENNECLELLKKAKVDTRLYIYVKYDDSFYVDRETQKIKDLYDYFRNNRLTGDIYVMYTSRDISENEVNDDLHDVLKKEGQVRKQCLIECGEYYYNKEEITTEIIKKKLEE